MKALTIGATITILSVEGKTSKVGAKQNKTYTITELSEVPNFYTAIDSKGKEATIWDLTEESGKIGIMRQGIMRMTYTSNYEIPENSHFDAPTKKEIFKGQELTRIDVAAIKNATPTQINEQVLYNGVLVDSISFGSIYQ